LQIKDYVRLTNLQSDCNLKSQICNLKSI
jgi:hypothetical protein